MMSTTPPAFHLLVKPTGSVCNLGCKYCFFLSKEKLYPGSHFRMTDEMLEAYIRQYIEAQQVPEAIIAWQGGEPTLVGLDFFRRSVQYVEKHRKPGMAINYSIQTNGTLLDDEWCAFLREHNFLVGISIDGPPELHNAYRVDKDGRPSSKRVLRGLDYMNKHNVDFNILCTVHAANGDHPLEVYRYFRDDLGIQFVQFIAIVEQDKETGFQEGNRVTDRSVKAEQYGNFLIRIFDEYLLGNIVETPMAELVASEKQLKFGQDKLDALPQYCRACEVRVACHGGCPKNRFIETPTGKPGLNYLCAGYKTFFAHVDRPMRIMASLLRQNRAPAEIIQLEARLQTAFARARPNEPCPCGSGRMFRACHGAQ